MARLDVNRSGELEVFVRAVELGGFSAAARHFRMTPSAVSKLVARLESRLGARLVNRSTRKLQLTAEGAAFFDRGVRILGDLDTAEYEAGAGASPRGQLRVNANVMFGHHFLLPIIPGFLAQYPGIGLNLTLTDVVIDLLDERADIAIRTGPLKTSALVARKIWDSPVHVVASPAYLRAHGKPRTPGDLARHNVLGFGFARHIEGLPFRDGNGGILTVPFTGNMLVSDGEAMRLLALTGLGIARLSRNHIAADLEAGRLVVVLEDYNPRDIESIYAVFLGHGGHLPARVRAFLDYLVAHVKAP